MIGRLLCMVGRHDWSPWWVGSSGRLEHRVCNRPACRGRTREARPT